MPNETKKVDYSKFNMVQVLGTSTVAGWGDKLNLTQEQRTRAAATAMELASDYKLSQCDQFSLAKFCFETVRYGFIRNDCIYPVPYKGKVQAQLGYKGYRELALRAGYRDVNCSEVLSCDRIIRDRDTGKVKVIFEEDYTKTEKATVIGYYAYAIEYDGSLANSKYWTKEKCVKHGQHYSQSYSSIWGTEENFTKMAMKTVIKQLCQELRSTPELQMALKQDQIVYGGKGEKDTYADNPQNFKKTPTTKEINEEVIDIAAVDKDDSMQEVIDSLEELKK